MAKYSLFNCLSGVKILAKRPSADLEDGEISKEEEEKVTAALEVGSYLC